MSKKSFIDSVEVKRPCTEDWNKMHGNDRVRFCEHCATEVQNLSVATRKEAMRLVRASGGKLCIRYVANPTTKRPLFARQLLQITRRSASVPTAVVSASITLSSLIHAEENPRAPLPPAVPVAIGHEGRDVKKEIEPKEDGASLAELTGRLMDPAGAVIPGMIVKLLGSDESPIASTSSSDEGLFRFPSIKTGKYSIVVPASSGFAEARVINIDAPGGQERAVNIEVQVGVGMLMGITVSVDYQQALHRAVANDDIEQVRDSIVKGENVNGKDENYDKITPLFIAVENGNLEIARMLLEFGAKVNARDAAKQTPLMWLDEDATPELVELLLANGAKVDAKDREGNSTLMLAADRVKPEVLRVLTHGSDVDLANKTGQTALMNAANADMLENVRVLLLAGAKVNLRNKEKETAWDLASDNELRKLLEIFGAETRPDVEEDEDR